MIGKKSKLKKELRLIDVFTIATGTTISSGFFLLPGLLAIQAGPALVAAYIIAVIPLIPSLLSILELSTAMPRAGGVYYFLDRTLGPYFGTIGGFGTWLILLLKVSFALIGMGAYISIFMPDLPIVPVAVGFAILLGIVSLFGAKKTGGLQIILVFGLLLILAYFIGGGVFAIKISKFTDAFAGMTVESMMAAAGLIFISYGGITKVVSLSEEIENPERNLPLGIFLALGVVVLVFVLGTAIMVGVVPMDVLAGDLTPASTAAKYFLGSFGVILLSAAALFAFISVANAGTLSASRFPLAMSRDHITPRIFLKMTGSGTPYVSIITTVAAIVAILLLFDAKSIAKLASAFQLLVFAFLNISVIIMRESKIDSYDPGFRSPLYPWVQIFGVIGSLALIVTLGMKSILFSSGLIVVGSLWYYYYTRKRVIRTGAIYHIFERLGKFRYKELDAELRDIMKEKGLRAEDPFNEIVARAMVLDFDHETRFDDVVVKVADWLTNHANPSAEEIKNRFLEGNRTGATPVTHGFALPHLRLEGLDHPELVLVRSKGGMRITLNNPLNDNEEEEEIVKAVFFLASPQKDPAQHLRILAKIAGRVDEDTFMDEWDAAKDEEGIKLALSHQEGSFSFMVMSNSPTEFMVGKALRELKIPEGCLIVVVRRGEEIIVPRGSTVFQDGDTVTVIGEPGANREMRQMCGIT